MATAILSTQTPKGSNGMTLHLSPTARVIAHAGNKWKAGYITVERLVKEKGVWRKAHIARVSFEKLVKSSQTLLHKVAACEHGEETRVSLTKKQVLQISAISVGKTNTKTLHYISLLHITSAEGKQPEVFNHAKTINFTVEEFRKLTENYECLQTVMKSTNEDRDQDERIVIKAYSCRARTYRGRRSRCPTASR